MDYRDQLERIASKLERSAVADDKRRAFASSFHNYRVCEPLPEWRVAAFEAQFHVSLPCCYRAFITTLGHRGEEVGEAAAGPYYGLYPLGTNLNEHMDHPERYLSNPCPLYPDMPEREWQQLIAFAEEQNNDERADQDFTGKVFGGLLPIGTKGCSWTTGLVLNGPHRGRVVNVDLDLRPQHFAYQANFLDWYEDWLDEVISGVLRDPKRSRWFGYQKSGDVDDLIQWALAANNPIYQRHCLESIWGRDPYQRDRIHPLTPAQYRTLCNFLEDVTDDDLRAVILPLLAITNYTETKPKLKVFLAQNPDAALALILNYLSLHASDWEAEIAAQLKRPDLFSGDLNNAIWLAAHCRRDFSKLIHPHLAHPHRHTRKYAAETLVALAKKADRQQG